MRILAIILLGITVPLWGPVYAVCFIGNETMKELEDWWKWYPAPRLWLEKLTKGNK